MPLSSLPRKILVIGAGPIRIGHASVFDHAACTACDIFKAAGIRTVMVHCDPCALATDAEVADCTYLVPLSCESVSEIILREKPDAIFPTAGGPVALRLAARIAKAGLLGEQAIQILGVSESGLSLMHDPALFADTVNEIGLSVPFGRCVPDSRDAPAVAAAMGYPVFVRGVTPNLSRHHGITFNQDELADRMVDQHQLRIETVLSGYRQVEVVILRDAGGRTRTVAVAECLDPASIHSADAITMMPASMLDSQVLDQIRTSAAKLADAAGMTGTGHLKFAVSATTGEVLVLGMDAGYSRRVGMCATAFDLPLAALNARLSLGISLDDAISDEDHRRLDAVMAGAAVAVFLPCWEFERFSGNAVRLGSRTKSTGTVMGIGPDFTHALTQAMAARSSRSGKAASLAAEPADIPVDEMLKKLVLPTPDRLDRILAALSKGADGEAVARATGMAPAAVQLLAKAAADTTVSSDPRPHFMASTPNGRMWGRFPAGNSSHADPLGKNILVVGPVTSRIGQGIEVNHTCAHAAGAIRAAGRKAVLVSADAAPAYGPETFDRVYALPLSLPDILELCQADPPDGVILQFGGYRAMRLAEGLEQAGMTVLGTGHGAAALCQDRLGFSALLTALGISHAKTGTAFSADEALDLAESLTYPLQVHASDPVGGQRRIIVMDARMLEDYLMTAAVSPDAPLMMEQFLEYAIEVEADALCDGQSVYIPTVMEHIELAGVHPGDTTMVVPPYSTPPRHIETIFAIMAKIAPELGIRGLLNARFAILNDTVYLLEARPWACRTLPLVSMMTTVPMAERATQLMLGMTLEEMDLPRRILFPHYGIRSPVFPFDVFTETDPLPGPRMRSTGQAMTLADGFGLAYFNAKQAAGPALPLGGNVLITVTDADKPSILEPARLFRELGFGILATRGTHRFLTQNGIEAKEVKKLGFGRPDLSDSIKTGDVSMIINTPSGSQSQQDDAYIRKTATRYAIANVTTPAAALAAAKGIAARKRGQDALCTVQSYGRGIRR